MKRLLFTLLLASSLAVAQSQTLDSIIHTLDSLNNKVDAPAINRKGISVITNKATNLFLAEKTGTYLSDVSDLSLHKNSVILNTYEGTLAINHNFYPDQKGDKYVQPFFTMGAYANVFNSLLSSINKKQKINDFGFTVKRTWIAKTKTHLKDNLQQNKMQLIRASVLYKTKKELTKDANVFEESIAQINPANDTAARSEITQEFYTKLANDYTRKFDEAQSEALIETNNYSLISTSWTSVFAYIPLIRERFLVAPAITQSFNEQHAYPFELKINHTRFWESAKAGRFFLSFNGNLTMNNAAKNQLLNDVSLDEYKSGNGTDTAAFARLGVNNAYIGKYKNYLTPSARVQLVYIPPNWHLGLTLMMEQNFGFFHPLNGKIAVPIVLIDKKGTPAATFECQVLFFDMNNKVFPQRNFAGKTSIGLTVGIPFSKIIY